jgi:hypothetical protein
MDAPVTSRSNTDPPLAVGPIDVRRDDVVWRALDELVEGLGKLALAGDERFYPLLLQRAAAGLAAHAAAVWRPTALGGFVQDHCLGGLPPKPTDPPHAALLAQAASARVAVSAEIAPSELATVVSVRDAAEKTVAVIELRRSATGDAAREAVERVAEALAEAAAPWHAIVAARNVAPSLEHATRLLGVASRIAGDPRLTPTAYRIVAEVARLVGADRVSLVLAPRHGSKLLAVSGTVSPAPRSATADALRRVATHVARSALSPRNPNEDDDERNALLDVTHARVATFAPVVVAAAARRDTGNDPESAAPRVIGALIAERFDGASPLDEALLRAAGTACGPALQAALDASGSFAARAERFVRERWGDTRLAVRLALGAASLAAATALLCLIRIDHRVTLRGSIEPVVQRSVFAPADGIVESTPPEHGKRVGRGESLLRIHSPGLLLEEQRLTGELEALERERASIDARRLRGDDQPDAPAALGAEGLLIDARIQGLASQRELVRAERESLAITAPIDGVVVTWRPDERLAGRPVERGQRLLTVADDRGAWRLQLKADDDRAGLIRAAAEGLGAPPVRFEVAGRPGIEHSGRVESIASTTERDPSAPAGAPATVRIDVALEDQELGNVAPGTSVRASVSCGPRAVGYVWFHDLWETLSVWWRL